MAGLSEQELHELSQAALSNADLVVHWRSTFGLVVIEVRKGNVYVNGDHVQPAACNDLEAKETC